MSQGMCKPCLWHLTPLDHQTMKWTVGWRVVFDLKTHERRFFSKLLVCWFLLCIYCRYCCVFEMYNLKTVGGKAKKLKSLTTCFNRPSKYRAQHLMMYCTDRTQQWRFCKKKLCQLCIENQNWLHVEIRNPTWPNHSFPGFPNNPGYQSSPFSSQEAQHGNIMWIFDWKKMAENLQFWNKINNIFEFSLLFEPQSHPPIPPSLHDIKILKWNTLLVSAVPSQDFPTCGQIKKHFL